MKKLNLIFAFLLAISTSTYAQTDVKLKINHMQGSKSFALNQQSNSTGGDQYDAKRVEYYISSVKLEHDSGTITEIDSLWILVDVAKGNTFDLGQFNITTLEAILFSVGVDTAVNHDDTGLWPNGHPLAPKSPSMHWGWVSGYRFFVMEGKCGENSLGNVYEFHSLGDYYYHPQRILTAGSNDTSDLTITLNADYDRVFDNIELRTDLIDHGGYPTNVQFLKNVRDKLFTSPEGNGNSLSPPVGISREVNNSVIQIYPNPSRDGIIHISTSNVDLSGSQVSIYDNTGRIVYETSFGSSEQGLNINLDAKGLYVLTINKDNVVVHRQLVVISE
jgi:hypothetical protein